MTKFLLLGFLLTIFSLTHAQEFEPQQRKTNQTVISINGNCSLVKDERLKKVWNPNYINVISVSSKANLKAFIKMEEILQRTPMLYNPQNTLVLSTGKYMEFVKEAAIGYTIVCLPDLNPSDSMITIGVITPLSKEEKESGYDFVFVVKDKLM